MYLPPLQPVINSEIRICGDVEIHPTASIASGVILQAAPNSRIVIGIDVCIGMGVIISAYGGVVEIADGTTLGSGVLVIGQSKIGRNACIGTATTIFNATVNSMAVIEPGSIIGDTSKSEKTEPVPQHPEPAITNSAPVIKPTSTDNNGQNLFEPAVGNAPGSPSTNSDPVIEPISTNNNIPRDNTRDNNSPREELEKEQITATDIDLEAQKQIPVEQKSSDHSGDPWSDKDSASTNSEREVDMTVKAIEKNLKTEDGTAIGKVYIDRLLVTLFPHKKHLNHNSSSEET